MGCDCYRINVPQSWTSERPDEPMYLECRLTFGEDTGQGCLCTFPVNYREKPEWVPAYNLALLGAAVVLAQHGHIEADTCQDIFTSIPQWILDGLALKIKRD